MEAFIIKHKDENVRMHSRSGGVFTALSDIILENGGVVYGCAMDKNNKAVHKRTATKKERDEFRGSKYVQSDMRGILPKIKEDLKAGKTVLFSGCSCQSAAVISFCKNIKSGCLYTITILCHGVPSPLVLEEYLQSKERKFNTKVKMLDFRNKIKYGWDAHYETIEYNGATRDSTEYSSVFYTQVATRESCFRCPYRSLTQPGDITICDAWGVNKKDADFNDNKGVSLVLIQSEEGKKLLNSVLDNCYYRNADMRNYMQGPLVRQYNRPENRDLFWQDLYRKSYEHAYKKYVKTPMYIRIQRKLAKMLKSKQRKNYE